MNASKINIRNVLGIHARGITFKPKKNPENGFYLTGKILPRYALMDLMNNFHVYFKEGRIVVITPGRLSVSQKNISA